MLHKKNFSLEKRPNEKLNFISFPRKSCYFFTCGFGNNVDYCFHRESELHPWGGRQKNVASCEGLLAGAVGGFAGDQSLT